MLFIIGDRLSFRKWLSFSKWLWYNSIWICYLTSPSNHSLSLNKHSKSSRVKHASWILTNFVFGGKDRMYSSIWVKLIFPSTWFSMGTCLLILYNNIQKIKLMWATQSLSDHVRDIQKISVLHWRVETLDSYSSDWFILIRLQRRTVSYHVPSTFHLWFWLLAPVCFFVRV